MPKAIDLTGNRYNRLLVLNKDMQDPTKKKWLCLCTCGNIKSIDRNSFIKGATTSCGCFHKEKITTHGQYKTRLYSIWLNMNRRCKSKDPADFKIYGSRGINVCHEWEYSFETFMKWALTNGYSNSLSIDRINDAKTYSPQTCRWATPTIQARNQRKISGSSGEYIGVHYVPSLNKFRTRIRVNKRSIHLGVFHTAKDAALVRDAFIKEHNLEGFPLNFP